MESNTTACEDTLLLLSRGLDRDLSRTETCQMYAHVAHCDNCRKAMGELAEIDGALKALHGQEEQAALGMDFHAEFMRKLNLQPAPSTEQQLQLFGRKVAHNETLRLQLKEAANETAFVTLYVQLGHASGYQFSAEQVASLLGTAAANDELSDMQLDQVAAAGHGFNSQKLLDLLATWTPR